MKKNFVILTVITALVIYAGLRVYNHVSDGEGRIPLPPGFVETPTEFNAMEKQMMDSIGVKCVNEGIIDLKDSTKFRDDGLRCITVMCGERFANSDYPEASGLLKECYMKHGFIYPPAEYSDMDSQPLDSLADALIFKCIALGVLDTTKPTRHDDGKRCATVLCGEKTANAEFPEAESLIRECYKKHFPRVKTTTEYNAEELKMIDALAHKCAKKGIIDMNNEIKDGDGDKCIIALCGEKAAHAELPEASKLLRECYEKNSI